MDCIRDRFSRTSTSPPPPPPQQLLVVRTYDLRPLHRLFSRSCLGSLDLLLLVVEGDVHHCSVWTKEP